MRTQKAENQSFGVIILAGGKGKRLGEDKALLSFLGKPLIDHVIGRVENLTNEILIVSDESKFPSLNPRAKLVLDLFPGGGPLGGIYSGLNISRNHWTFAFGCDMPFIQPSLLNFMISISEGFQAVVPLIEGKLQPLHALYSKSCLETFRGDLEKGFLKLTRTLSLLRLRYFTPEEARVYDPNLVSFFNINSGADLKKALNLAENLGSW